MNIIRKDSLSRQYYHERTGPSPIFKQAAGYLFSRFVNCPWSWTDVVPYFCAYTSMLANNGVYQMLGLLLGYSSMPLYVGKRHKNRLGSLLCNSYFCWSPMHVQSNYVTTSSSLRHAQKYDCVTRAAAIVLLYQHDSWEY